MTVAELIDKLKPLPQSLQVVHHDSEWGGFLVEKEPELCWASLHQERGCVSARINYFPEIPLDPETDDAEQLIVMLR